MFSYSSKSSFRTEGTLIFLSKFPFLSLRAGILSLVILQARNLLEHFPKSLAIVLTAENSSINIPEHTNFIVPFFTSDKEIFISSEFRTKLRYSINFV